MENNLEENQNEVVSSSTPSPLPDSKPTSEGFHINFRIPIRKKVLLYAILPILIVGLLLFGLIRQGILSDWSNGWKKASATLTVIDKDKKAVDSARVLIADQFATTDSAGKATLTGLVSGDRELSIEKTGYTSLKQTVKLKKGQNDLGTLTLNEAPVAKVNLTASVVNYISEENLKDATIKVDDIASSFDSGTYKLANVPVGKHAVTVSKTGFETLTSEVTVEAKTTTLEGLKLVPNGTIVFESNREGGLRGIFTSKYDGSAQKSLVSRVGSYEDYRPILGPNQRKVVFTSTRDGVKDEGGGYKTALYIVDIDGKNLTKVSDSFSDYSAKWSADGGYVSFFTYDQANSATRLSTYDVVKKALHKFDGYKVDGYAAFSLDGSHIAFSGSIDGVSTSSGIFYSKSDGTEIKKIEDNQSYSIEFTSTGKIRYSYWDASAKKTKYFEYDPTTNAKTEISVPEVDKFGAILSPDKKLRAYVSNRDGKTNLYISDPDGKNEKKLTEINKVYGDVLWSTDSSFIMFSVRSNDETARYLVSTNGTAKAKKIVDISLEAYGY